MKTFKQFIAEARGVFDDSHFGDTIISAKDDKYVVGQVGVIDDWGSFQLNKTIIGTGKKTAPKYWVQATNSKGKDIYFVAGALSSSPGSFEGGWSWSTTKGTKTLNMKPQNFKGLTDKWLSVDQIGKILSTSEYDYLTSAYNNVINGTPVKGYSEVSDNKATVMKDFGEILGPVWYLAQRNALKVGKVFLPAAGNEPLIDSIIKVKGDEVKISSKAGKGGSNTVKGKDIGVIIESLGKSEQKRLKTKYKTELALLDALETGTVVNGCVTAFSIINKQVAKKHSKQLKTLSGMSKKVILNTTVESDDPLLSTMRATVNVDEKKVKGTIESYAGILFMIKKFIEIESKSMRFGELFNDVTTGRVVYIIAKSIDKNGVISFIESNEDTLAKSAFIRSKASINRPTDDRPGIQPVF